MAIHSALHCFSTLTKLSFTRLYEKQSPVGEMIALLGTLNFLLVGVYDVVPDQVVSLGFQCDGLFLSRHVLEGVG